MWWQVLDSKDRECSSGEDISSILFNNQLLWPWDSGTHVEHQEFTRQHPLEKKRVIKVECGLAFDDKLVQVGENFEYVEVA